LVKLVKKYNEECKIAIRNVRKHVNDKLKKSEKSHEISEDESHKGADDIQKITNKFIAEVDKVSHAKEKAMMDV